MLKCIRMLTLLAGFLTSAVQAACPAPFAAGDTNYIAKLNQMLGCITASGISPLTTKGDLWGYSTLDARLAVGANGRVLTADSAQTLGVAWSAALDGVVIGGSTPAAATFTNVTATSFAYFSTYLRMPETSTPDSGTPPPNGLLYVWADSTSSTLKVANDAGTSSTVVPDTGAANNFLTAISSHGVISKAQPSISNLSGFGTGNATALAVNVGSTGSFNPMTTAGDIIIGGASGSPTRLAAGSTSGHVLTSTGAGSAPSWQAAAGGGGTLTATYVGYGDGSNALTGEAAFNYNATTNTLVADNISDAKGDVRIIVQNSQSAAYTTVISDCGKHLYHPSADTTARTFTIDSNANVAAPIGCALTFINDTSAGVITISITSDTLVLSGSGATGSRSLAASCMATVIKVTSTRWMISGGSCLTFNYFEGDRYDRLAANDSSYAKAA